MGLTAQQLQTKKKYRQKKKAAGLKRIVSYVPEAHYQDILKHQEALALRTRGDALAAMLAERNELLKEKERATNKN